MAKTLLNLTQNILSAMDSDEVNSIYDSVEAIQVATIILETLEAEFNNIDLPELSNIVQLTSASNLALPNYLHYGSDVNGITTLRYRNFRNNGNYQEVQYLTPDQFWDRQLLYLSTGPNTVQITDPSGISYYINDNRVPSYYTSVNNDYLIFDSYDADHENTLEGLNSFALAVNNIGSVSIADGYVPPISDSLFPLLLAEAKATCFLILKQLPSPKHEQIARRQRSRMQKNLYKSRKASYPYVRSKYDFSRNR